MRWRMSGTAARWLWYRQCRVPETLWWDKGFSQFVHQILLWLTNISAEMTLILDFTSLSQKLFSYEKILSVLIQVHSLPILLLHRVQFLYIVPPGLSFWCKYETAIFSNGTRLKNTHTDQGWNQKWNMSVFLHWKCFWENYFELSSISGAQTWQEQGPSDEIYLLPALLSRTQTDVTDVIDLVLPLHLLSHWTETEVTWGTETKTKRIGRPCPSHWLMVVNKTKLWQSIREPMAHAFVTVSQSNVCQFSFNLINSCGSGQLPNQMLLRAAGSPANRYW